MRNLILAAALAATMLSGSACKRRHPTKVGQTEEEAPQMATMVHVADPRSASQLVTGFHDIEQNSWRWTAGHFSVMLRPPRDAAQKGASLQLKFSVPEPVIQRLKAISLSANIGKTNFPPETYTQPGEFTFTRDVPPSLLAGDAVKVNFALDKSLPPSPADQRELGVVVTAVGFEAK